MGVQGPFGVFVLPAAVKEIVLFAGGIGIAPFRSIIREVLAKQLPIDTTLFYSNRYVEESSFFEEIDDFERACKRFKAVVTLTGDDTPSAWTREIGRIDRAMIARHLPDLSRSLFYMCGPESFMEHIKTLLTESGVDVKTRLKKELFG